MAQLRLLRVTYHRLESRTQTPEDATLQVASGEIWGRRPLWSPFPKVQAFFGPLPEGARGIEFTTDVPPNPGGYFRRPEWSGPRSGVRVEDEFAKISVATTKNTQV